MEIMELRRSSAAGERQDGRSRDAAVVSRLSRTWARLGTAAKAAALAGLLLLAVLAANHVTRDAIDGWWQYRPQSAVPRAADVAAADAFLADPSSPPAAYEALVAYVLQGFVANATPEFGLVHYPGFPGSAGFRVNGLEGFARTTPLFAAWIHSGRGTTLTGPDGGRAVDLVAMIRSGILAGTDPASADYWGPIGSNDQRIVEAADIARVLWLTRAQVWDRLDPAQARQVVRWLSGVNGAAIGTRNNWILFPEVVNAFLKSVGAPHRDGYPGYREFKANLREHGWFIDGPQGRVDYYNAWGISYDLFWLATMDPDLDPEFVRDTVAEAGDLTAHLVSPQGVPLMGRSLCYRTAVPAAIVAASALAPDAVSPAVARRALDVVWRHFVAHGLLRDGTITMGVWDNDPRLVDNYTGPGSCHWGLRSLVLAVMQPMGEGVWAQPAAPLPVEVADFRLALPRLRWTVIGRRDSGEIMIVRPDAVGDPVIRAQSWWDRALEVLERRPRRPANEGVKYGCAVYSTARPIMQGC